MNDDDEEDGNNLVENHNRQFHQPTKVHVPDDDDGNENDDNEKDHHGHVHQVQVERVPQHQQQPKLPIQRQHFPPPGLPHTRQ